MLIIHKDLIGREFTVLDPTITYTLVAVADGTGTIAVVGMKWDSVNNRTMFKTFKITDITMIGK